MAPNKVVLALLEGLDETAEAAERRAEVLQAEGQKMLELAQRLLDRAYDMRNAASILQDAVGRLPDPVPAVESPPVPDPPASKPEVVAPEVQKVIDDIDDLGARLDQVAEPAAEPAVEAPADEQQDEEDAAPAPPPSVVGAKGEVTLKVAANAATRLKDFTRRELADELGLSPLATGRWIAQMQAREIITTGGKGFVIHAPQSDADKAPAPTAEAKPTRKVEIPEALRAMPALHGVTESTPEHLLNRKISLAEKQHMVLEYVNAHPTTIVTEAVAALPYPQSAISEYLRALDDAGLIKRTGRNRFPEGHTGSGRAAVEFASLTAESEDERIEIDVRPKTKVTPKVEFSEVEAKALATVRTHVMKTKGPFTPRQVADAVEMSEIVALVFLDALVERRVIHDVSPAPDMRLFEFEPVKAPKAPKRAEKSAKVGDSAPRRGAPVSGTGGQNAANVKANNPEVQSLIDAARSAGAEVSKATNGHFAVLIPEDGDRPGARVLISATPSGHRTVLNDRARLRRAGLGV